jgi:hypothetical protein
MRHGDADRTDARRGPPGGAGAILAPPLVGAVVRGRGMSRLGEVAMDALPGLIGGLVSGLVAGHYAARTEVSYQRRATVVTELRGLIFETNRPFRSWIMKSDYPSEPEDLHAGFYEVAAKVDALASYYGVHAEWLSSRTRESIEEIIEGFREHNTRLMDASVREDQLEERREAAWRASQWLDFVLPDLMDDIHTLPSWRRRQTLF